MNDVLIKKLKYKELFIQKALVAGQWCPADNHETYPVINPATGEVIAVVPRLGRAETNRAVDAAGSVGSDWSTAPADQRSTVLIKWADLLREHSDDIAILMCAEQGKPVAEAKGEVMYAASYAQWFGEEAKRACGQIIPSHRNDQRFLTMVEPVGIGVAITPWNFPAAMVTRKLAPALAAGCPIILKPSEMTPLTALAMAMLALDAGIPPKAISVLTGDKVDAPVIGETLMARQDIKKISFTGSTQVGKILAAQAATTMKKVCMELGGNAPFLVFDDANIDSAIDNLIASKFRNAGQVCIAPNRVLVQSSLVDEFVTKLTEKVSEIVVGNGFDEGVVMGPLINQAAIDKCERHISDAVSKGAKIICGGKKIEGNFFAPTILTNITTDMILSHEETFGPVAAITTFDTEAQAIDMANNTPFGLAAYFFTENRARCWRLSEQLNAGMVGENTGIMSSERTPFGGVKESGIGREGAHIGLEEWLEVKYRCVGGLE